MIYFAQADDPAGPIKIGTTKNLKQRLYNLCRQQGQPFKVLGVLPGKFREERTLHRQFNHLALGGEWFNPAGELLDFINSNAIPLEKFTQRRVIQPDGIEPHYRPQEIAQALGVTPDTIKSWVKSGKLRAVKVSKTVRIPASELTRLGVKVSYDESTAD